MLERRAWFAYHMNIVKERKTDEQAKETTMEWQDLIVYATHEAGLAVVGHVIERLIDEVSIVPNREYRYPGY